MKQKNTFFVTWFVALAFVCSSIMMAGPVMAADKGSLHVAFDGIPETDMLNFLVAVARAGERGVKVKISYLQSEDIAAQAIVSGQADIGVGTPYALIQKVKAPIRMFYQLSKLRFFPVVNTEYFKTWKDLDGAEMYVHSRGSGTEAIMNLMAKKNGITYKSISYLPKSSVRAGALMQGRIKATIVDAERWEILKEKGKGKYAALPMPELDGSDEALFANTKFLESKSGAVNILLEELIKTWREIKKDPEYAVRARKKYNLLPDMDPKDVADIGPFYTGAVKAGIYPSNGGGENAVKGDFEFYGFAGTIKGDISQLKVEDFWYLDSLNKALDKLGRVSE